MLFAAAVFTGPRYRWARRGLLASGALCLIGLVGPILNMLAWRGIGIFGYAVVFSLTCLALSRAFTTTTAPSVPPDAPVDRSLASRRRPRPAARVEA